MANVVTLGQQFAGQTVVGNCIMVLVLELLPALYDTTAPLGIQCSIQPGKATCDGCWPLRCPRRWRGSRGAMTRHKHSPASCPPPLPLLSFFLFLLLPSSPSFPSSPPSNLHHFVHNCHHVYLSRPAQGLRHGMSYPTTLVTPVPLLASKLCPASSAAEAITAVGLFGSYGQ